MINELDMVNINLKYSLSSSRKLKNSEKEL